MGLEIFREQRPEQESSTNEVINFDIIENDLKINYAKITGEDIFLTDNYEEFE